jgi:hypothetical protein
MKTRSVSQEDYDAFINDCKIYWVWIRVKRRFDTLLDIHRFITWKQDPIALQWKHLMYQMDCELRHSDGVYLDDPDMSRALFNCEFHQWDFNPPINPSNGREWIV